MGIRYLLSSVSGAAVTAELQSYGLDVIQDDPLRAGSVRVDAVQAFIDRHRVVEDTPIVRTAPGALLARVFDEATTHIPSNRLLATGWDFVPGEAVTAEAATTRLAERLLSEQAVTVTSASARLLDRALASADLVSLTAWQRLVLLTLVWVTTRTDRAVLVAIRPPRGLRTTIGWGAAGRLFTRFPRKRVRWSPRR